MLFFTCIETNKRQSYRLMSFGVLICPHWKEQRKYSNTPELYLCPKGMSAIGIFTTSLRAVNEDETIRVRVSHSQQHIIKHIDFKEL